MWNKKYFFTRKFELSFIHKNSHLCFCIHRKPSILNIKQSFIEAKDDIVVGDMGNHCKGMLAEVVVAVLDNLVLLKIFFNKIKT